MKKNLVLILVCIFTQNCIAQETKKTEVNFFDFIEPSGAYFDISIGNCPLSSEITISYFRRGFDVYQTNKNGLGVFFAIPKKEFGVWRKESLSELKREDLRKNSQEKNKNAKDFLFSFSKDSLSIHFDLYVFYVKQEDLVQEGGYVSDDGQLMEDYHSKDNATVYTYKYENGVWKEIDKDDIKSKSTRSFGENAIRKILQERFADPSGTDL